MFTIFFKDNSVSFNNTYLYVFLYKVERISFKITITDFRLLFYHPYDPRALESNN